MDFDNEKYRQYDADARQVFDIWGKYLDDKGREAVHQPPGLIKACTYIFTQVMRALVESQGIFAVLDEVKIGAILANIFEFAQYAYVNGVKVSELAACECDFELTDEDIAKLLNAHNN